MSRTIERFEYKEATRYTHFHHAIFVQFFCHESVLTSNCPVLNRLQGFLYCPTRPTQSECYLRGFRNPSDLRSSSLSFGVSRASGVLCRRRVNCGKDFKSLEESSYTPMENHVGGYSLLRKRLVWRGFARFNNLIVCTGCSVLQVTIRPNLSRRFT